MDLLVTLHVLFVLGFTLDPARGASVKGLQEAAIRDGPHSTGQILSDHEPAPHDAVGGDEKVAIGMVKQRHAPMPEQRTVEGITKFGVDDEKTVNYETDGSHHENNSWNEATRNNTQLQNQARSNRDAIAFTARLSSDTDVPVGYPIRFDEVITNVGGPTGSGLYFPDSGIFACLDESYYRFTWSIQAPMFKYAKVKLVRGSEVIKEGLETRNNTGSSYVTGTSEMSVIAQCKLNTGFKVEPVSAPGSTAWVAFSGLFTSFSGYRLPDNGSNAVSVELSKGTSVFPDQIVKYDNVLLQTSGDYVDSVGLFQCPDDSLYGVDISLTSQSTVGNTRAVSSVNHADTDLVDGPVTCNFFQGTTGTTSILGIVQCVPQTGIWTNSKVAGTGYSVYAPQGTSMNVFKIAADAATAIAFSAALTNQVSWQQDQTLVYNKVLLNIGGAYDQTRGEFRCMDDGVYVFSVSLTVNRSAQVKLMKDNTEVNLGPHTDYYSADPYGSGTSTTTTVVRCTTASRISVRFGLNTGWGSSAYAFDEYNFFSGYKIEE